ncbi:GLPGLI family protein [Riemerella columbina]|uniref:GLPGLI family protein n=1 Tax=Riemerella columbina TaxID=103810 RepID=UPI000374ECD9|nr:GLPGLI family protein [Riemerella columbina]
MGTIKLFRLIILLFSFSTYAQGIVIDYAMVSRPNQEDKTIIDKATFSLLVDTNSGTSLFKLNQPKEIGEEQYNNLLAYSYQIYKRYTSSQFCFEKINYSDYKTPYPNLNNWVITNEEKSLLDYRVRKAKIEFGGRQWEAWYAENISIMDGPYKFSGLPGLILEIYSLDNDYQFTAVAIKNENVSINMPKSIDISQAQLLEFKSKIIEDPTAYLKQMLAQNKSQKISLSINFNGKEIDDKELIRNAEKNYQLFLKKYNNPIDKNDIWVK